MPRVITIVLSNSTKNGDATPLNHRHVVKFTKSMTTCRFRLIGYSVVKGKSDKMLCLELRMPFLESHAVGASFNAHSNQVVSAMLDYDKNRISNNGIYLPLQLSGKQTIVPFVSESYSVACKRIPSSFEIDVRNAEDGSGYTNIQHIYLKIEID